MAILPVRALRDNYIWMIVDADSRFAFAVDPGEAQPVLDFLQKNDCVLKGILVTHHHADHTDGIPGLLSRYPALRVIASENSAVSGLTDRLAEGARFRQDFLDLSVLAIPGHTLDHVAYFGDGSVFCGDTLFSAGCGRVFEGTPAMMYATLQKLAALPPGTKIYCGHEYTAANLQFARTVEPENPAIRKKIKSIAGESCTLPSTIGEEWSFNPFLRCSEPAVIAAVEKVSGEKTSGPADVFRLLREWKNQFA